MLLESNGLELLLGQQRFVMVNNYTAELRFGFREPGQHDKNVTSFQKTLKFIGAPVKLTTPVIDDQSSTLKFLPKELSPHDVRPIKVGFILQVLQHVLLSP